MKTPSNEDETMSSMRRKSNESLPFVAPKDFFNQGRPHSAEINILYHGSPIMIDRLTVYESRRADKRGVQWHEKAAIFATPDYRIALHYTANKMMPESGISAGIDLITLQDPEQPVIYGIYGGHSLEDALDQLYGRLDHPESCKGYIYYLKGLDYKHEVGLGMNEKITRKLDSVLFREEVNRRELINTYIAAGKIVIHYVNDLQSLIKKKL